MIKAQHPEVHERKIGGVYQWFFRYYEDIIENGAMKRIRRSYVIGPSRDKDHPMGIKEARAVRDAFFARVRGSEAAAAEEAHVERQPEAKKAEAGDVTFGTLAEAWRREYVEGKAAGKPLLARPTRDKYLYCLELLLPRWSHVAIKDLRAKDVLDWLQKNATSWHSMAGLRNVMSGIITKAIQWDLLPETFANPIHRVRLPKKTEVFEKRILTPEQTAQVLALLEDPNLLICETCLDTGARISEATGLMIKHVNLDKGTISIEQRNHHMDIDVPKTAGSRRVLAIGALTERYQTWIAKLERKGPNDWVFPQDVDLSRPRWDCGVRKALKLAARSLKQNTKDQKDPGLDFKGFGLHSLRRANISWRQDVGGSTIEASKIAGHSKVDTTLQYTFIRDERHQTLTRRIQEMRQKAASNTDLPAVQPASDLLRRQRERAKIGRAARKRSNVVEITKEAVA